MTTDEVIQEEIQSILDDILQLYEEDKKVSGEFEHGLEAEYTPGKAVIKGYAYLAGRGAGKMPPISAILSWVYEKGIFTINSEAQARGLSFAIAKKIAEKGTAQEYELKVYEKVITPERIDKIINRVSELNVNRLVSDIRIQIELLAKDI